MVNRRRFLIGALALAGAPPSRGQPAGRTHRVAVVLAFSPLAEMAGPKSKFELVVNVKTARALGLTIPPTLLRADRVVE